MSDDNVVDLNSRRQLLADDWKANKQDVIIDIAVAVTHDIIDQLNEAGYSFENTPEIAYDLIMLTEAIKSIVHTAEGDYYPLHKIAEGLFDEEDVDGFIEEFIE